jgi:hypothetical protein
MPFAIRNVPLAVATLAALLGIAACGNGQSQTAKSTPAAAPNVSAVNLRASDVPGMATLYPAGGSPGKLAPTLLRCRVAIAGFEPGSVISAIFRPEGSFPTEQIWSAVRVAPTAAIAAHDAAANTSPQVQACAARAVAALYTSRGPLVHKSTKASALAVRDIPKSFGFSLVYRETLANANPHAESEETPLARKLGRIRAFPKGIALDALGFASGRLEVALVAFRPADASVEKERRLLLRLYDRAKASR